MAFRIRIANFPTNLTNKGLECHIGSVNRNMTEIQFQITPEVNTKYRAKIIRGENGEIAIQCSKFIRNENFIKLTQL